MGVEYVAGDERIMTSLADTETRDGLTSSHNSDSDTSPPKSEFNEQTNYVAPRKIVTVRPIPTRCQLRLTRLDLPGLCWSRLAGSHGPDHASGQLVHDWKCLGINRPGVVDRKRLFHVCV